MRYFNNLKCDFQEDIRPSCNFNRVLRRSPDPSDSGNSTRRQNGPRLCEEAETTIRHDVNAPGANEREAEEEKEEDEESRGGASRTPSRLAR